MKGSISSFAALVTLVGICTASDLKPRLAEVSTIDDANFNRITYEGDWTHLTHLGSFVFDGTESYSHDFDAQYSFGGVEKGGNITLYASKTKTRGYFDIYQGDTYLGTGDAHNATCNSKCMTSAVFTYGKLPNSENVTVVNREFDNRVVDEAPILGLDYVSILTIDECTTKICPL